MASRAVAPEYAGSEPGGLTGPAPGEAQSRRGRAARFEELRYLVFGCAAPAALFGLLGWYNLSRLHNAILGSQHPESPWQWVTGPGERALYLAFVSIPVAIYITRPRAQRRIGGLIPRLAAFTGTTMLLVYPAFFDNGPRVGAAPRIVQAIAASALVCFTALGVWGLVVLRHSFSIIPEARQVVSEGPYRYVRHPLYTAEIGVAVSLALQGDLHVYSTVVLAAFVGIQLIRSGYEERLLRATFPGYAEYAARTPRLVPLLRTPG
jgi:protein-S-isoprenylcysteine O-methyltransferase Ste14